MREEKPSSGAQWFSMEEQHCHLSPRNRNADAPHGLSRWNQTCDMSTDKGNHEDFFDTMLKLCCKAASAQTCGVLFVRMLQAKKVEKSNSVSRSASVNCSEDQAAYK